MSSTQLIHQQWLESIPPEDRKLLERGKNIATQVVANARDARKFWDVWESLNNRLAPEKPLAQALAWYSPRDLGPIRRAVAEATVLAVLRISDHPKSETATACNLAGLLRNERVFELVTHDLWLSGGTLELDSWVLDIEREKQPERISQFLDRVPHGWAKADSLPDDDALHRSRVVLKGMRDKIIAHSDLSKVSLPKVDEVRQALFTSVEIAQLGSLIFLGTTSGLDVIDNDATPSGDVWHYFEKGLSSDHRAWLSEVDQVKGKE